MNELCRYVSSGFIELAYLLNNHPTLDASANLLAVHFSQCNMYDKVDILEDQNLLERHRFNDDRFDFTSRLHRHK